MAKTLKTLDDPLVLEAALEGLELQKSRIEAQILEIRNRLGKRSRTPAEAGHNAAKKRTLSPEARKRIATAQKKRWAEYRKSTASPN
jgi:hypothetical protein